MKTLEILNDVTRACLRCRHGARRVDPYRGGEDSGERQRRWRKRKERRNTNAEGIWIRGRGWLNENEDEIQRQAAPHGTDMPIAPPASQELSQARHTATPQHTGMATPTAIHTTPHDRHRQREQEQQEERAGKRRAATGIIYIIYRCKAIFCFT